jgi:hypothetical protein
VQGFGLALGGLDLFAANHLEGPLLGITRTGHEELPFRTRLHLGGIGTGNRHELPGDAGTILLAALQREAFGRFGEGDLVLFAIEGGGGRFAAQALSTKRDGARP